MNFLKIWLILILSILVSCTAVKELQVSSFNPRPVCLEIIENRPSIPDVYVCRQKSRDAYKCLLTFAEEGNYTVRVVRGPADGWEKEYHCWIELEHKEVLYWYGPAWYKYDPVKYGCHKASQWTDRKAIRNKTHGVKKATGDTSPPRRIP